MNQTAELVQMVPGSGVKASIVPGLKTAWVGQSEVVNRAARLADSVANYPISNAELLAASERCQPPQSWYDEDYEGLY